MFLAKKDIFLNQIFKKYEEVDFRIGLINE